MIIQCHRGVKQCVKRKGGLSCLWGKCKTYNVCAECNKDSDCKRFLGLDVSLTPTTQQTKYLLFTVVRTSSSYVPGLYPEHVLPPRLLPRPSDACVDLPHLPRPRPARQRACHLPHCERRSPSDSPYTVPHLLQIEDAKNLVRRSKL